MHCRNRVPVALLRTLSTYQVLGPHLRGVHERAALQAGVAAAPR